jgi:thiol-disulfide isomerase/thioredoxin
MPSSLLLRSALALFCASCVSTTTPAHSQVAAAAAACDAAVPASAARATQAAPTSAPYLLNPHFTAAIAEGKKLSATGQLKFTLDEMGGRVVLIDFWATWCGPCNEELPHMKKIAKAAAKDAVEMIALSCAPQELTLVEYVARWAVPELVRDIC